MTFIPVSLALLHLNIFGFNPRKAR
ncbi:uncharacterized protein METZ01_LOCUS220500, partial [marine metagenome]